MTQAPETVAPAAGQEPSPPHAQVRSRSAAAVVGVSAAGLRSLSSRVVVEVRRVHRLARPFLAPVTPLGWAVIGLGVAAWIAGARLGWRELLLAAATCLFSVLICAVTVIGRGALKVSLTLDPVRVLAGDPSAGRITVSNPSSRRSRSMEVELPVGEGRATFAIGALAAGHSTEELFVIPTERRGVIPVGPATTIKADPLGLFVRRAAGGDPTELLIYPRTVPIAPFGTGLLRDLEGLTTKEVSSSDLAFHSLRDYSEGDDFRFVHWRSSAKAGKLQIRQFLDTRRSTVTVVVDARSRSYGHPEEFEIGLQVAGSLALRALRDGLQVLLAVGSQSGAGNPHRVLDCLARATLDSAPGHLAAQVARAEKQAHDATIAIVVTGSRSDAGDVQQAAARFGAEVRVVGIRVVPGAPATVAASGRITLVQLAQLDDLPGLVASQVMA